MENDWSLTAEGSDLKANTEGPSGLAEKRDFVWISPEVSYVCFNPFEPKTLVAKSNVERFLIEECS